MMFGQNPMIVFRVEDVQVKKFTNDGGLRPVTIAHPEHFVPDFNSMSKVNRHELSFTPINSNEESDQHFNFN